jgi:D-arabinose 1-dehydrogenase-like Zn-dependent alcohol dehydrogenase
MALELPKTYLAQVFEEPNQPLVLKELPLELPKEGEILIKVHVCGVCHSDAAVKQGYMGSLYVEDDV